MKQQIKRMIEGEDKKNPLTDRQIAFSLGLKREQVTKLRHQQGIAHSRERRRTCLEQALKDIGAQHGSLSEMDITNQLKHQGFVISRFTVRQYQSSTQICCEQQSLPIQESVVVRPGCQLLREVPGSAKQAFAHIIGGQGSLKAMIESAKAAVFYPPKGLHTLILGEPGVGKSDLAEAMFQYFQHVRPAARSKSFVFFNCADYANNPQLLMAQLFGYVKGAFTGADADKAGLVEKADHGVLFLDEVHRLPPEGQELLFYLMDKGSFRRLGESNALRRITVMIIAATTESPESSLLTAFRRRIPMVIDVPALVTRPLTERMKLIHAFFAKETRRIDVPIKVAPEVIRALLLYDCPGNIGQLMSDIQVVCAKSFLNYITRHSAFVEVKVSDLAAHVKTGLLKMHNRGEIVSLTNDPIVVSPDGILFPELAKENVYALPSEIYRYIEQRYQDLQNDGLHGDVINHIIGSELELRFKRMIKNIGLNARPVNKDDLIKIIGLDIVVLAERIIKVAERKMAVNGEGLLYCLAIHLRTALDRLRDDKAIVNPQLKKIKQDYAVEYAVAQEAAVLVEQTMDIILPEDEVGFIALYFSTLTNKDEKVEGRVGIVLISHGHVALGMADVANRLLSTSHAKGVEMSLDESAESALERAVEAVRNADEGKGVLLLVDMGSLVAFGEIITQKTGIVTRVISRVDTLMAIDIVRRAVFTGASLDELANTIGSHPKQTACQMHTALSARQPSVIIVVCVTGQGAALKLKTAVDSLLVSMGSKVEVIVQAAFSGQLTATIAELANNRQVLAIVGTVKVMVENIPFITAEELLGDQGGDRLKQLLAGFEQSQPAKPGVGLADVINADLVMLDASMTDKQSIIKELSSLMIQHGYVRPDFMRGVLAREQLGTGSTYLGNQMALPHADPSYTLKPGIAIARLQQSVDWDGKPVQLVFMLAVTTSSQKFVEDLYYFTISENFANNLRQAASSRQLVRIIKDFWK